MDEHGDFVVVGATLEEASPGAIVPVPNRTVIVSKDTVPPLDENGREDFSNPLTFPFGAAYTVVRELNLEPGSHDLYLVLYTASYGPFEGDFGGGPRIPALGQSRYNLSAAASSCPEIFPSASQRRSYMQPGLPLHLARIWGLQGDQIAHDVETGQPFTPFSKSGAGCGAGCPGENTVTFRSRTTPITLGEWLSARGEMKITLTKYSPAAGAYTAAHFDLSFKRLLPRSMYTALAIRVAAFAPPPTNRIPDPLVFPNLFVTDEKGNGRLSGEVPNPFPDPATDDAALRIVQVAVAFHSDYQNWGACSARLGPGVDVHVQFYTAVDGTTDITNFITKRAP